MEKKQLMSNINTKIIENNKQENKGKNQNLLNKSLEENDKESNLSKISEHSSQQNTPKESNVIAEKEIQKAEMPFEKNPKSSEEEETKNQIDVISSQNIIKEKKKSKSLLFPALSYTWSKRTFKYHGF